MTSLQKRKKAKLGFGVGWLNMFMQATKGLLWTTAQSRCWEEIFPKHKASGSVPVHPLFMETEISWGWNIYSFIDGDEWLDWFIRTWKGKSRRGRTKRSVKELVGGPLGHKGQRLLFHTFTSSRVSTMQKAPNSQGDYLDDYPEWPADTNQLIITHPSASIVGSITEWP